MTQKINVYRMAKETLRVESTSEIYGEMAKTNEEGTVILILTTNINSKNFALLKNAFAAKGTGSVRI